MPTLCSDDLRPRQLGCDGEETSAAAVLVGFQNGGDAWAKAKVAPPSLGRGLNRFSSRECYGWKRVEPPNPSGARAKEAS
jgi:hypothetical protein